jgi:translation initiation factor 2A
MASVQPPAPQEQYAYRAQKSLGVVLGNPTYSPVDAFQAPNDPARTYVYSLDGSLFAYAIPGSVRIFAADGLNLVRELAIPAAIELRFSPLGTFLSTWERPAKLEEGAQHKNSRVWSIASGEQVTSFTQKSQENWDLQYTPTESHAVRQVGPEIQVYHPSDWNKGIVEKLKVEGLTSFALSPGRNPTIAVFVGERKSQPASIRIHSLLGLAAPPTCQKTFFKADSATLKWNALGTQVLVMTHTDVDKTNKSYYGETGLYLLSAAGNFDCRVTLDKEGPIHDFSWSPNSKEFGVIYGYMPSKAVLFDQRVKQTADFGSHPWNFISFNPQGRLVALAGFGNLAGKISIFDRRSLNQVCIIDAPNTSHCEWSPDGRFLLTATLSPRLRVDNGIKIWHCTGPLIHVHPIDELYQASWRRGHPDRTPQFPAVLPPAPSPAPSVLANAPAKATPAKPAGAYRPPGARGHATPSIFKREDEGGVSHTPSNGIATPPSRNGTPVSNGHGHYGRGGYQRHVPGAPPPSNSADNHNHNQNGQNGEPKKARSSKKNKKNANGNAEGGIGEVSVAGLHISLPPVPGGVSSMAGALAVPADMFTPGLETPATEGLDPLAKKIRNLTKKLKAIEDLKVRVDKGDRLEATQLKKIEGEAEIRKELAAIQGPSA